MTTEPNEIQILEADLDVRLMPLLLEIPDEVIPEMDWQLLLTYLRSAYGLGYLAARQEERRGEGGNLCADHGYADPGNGA